MTETAVKIAVMANKMTYHLSDEEAFQVCEQLQDRIARSKTYLYEKLRLERKKK